jgi:hypothetical protein
MRESVTVLDTAVVWTEISQQKNLPISWEHIHFGGQETNTTLIDVAPLGLWEGRGAADTKIPED